MDKDLEILQAGVRKLEKATSTNPSFATLVPILEEVRNRLENFSQSFTNLSEQLKKFNDRLEVLENIQVAEVEGEEREAKIQRLKEVGDQIDNSGDDSGLPKGMHENDSKEDKDKLRELLAEEQQLKVELDGKELAPKIEQEVKEEVARVLEEITQEGENDRQESERVAENDQ